MSTAYVGQAMKRKEDPRLITGRGHYIDDHTPMGTVWMAFVRSPEAHARITSIDKSAAEERPDVVGVYTHEDLAGDFAAPMPSALTAHRPSWCRPPTSPP